MNNRRHCCNPIWQYHSNQPMNKRDLVRAMFEFSRQLYQLSSHYVHLCIKATKSKKQFCAFVMAQENIYSKSSFEILKRWVILIQLKTLKQRLKLASRIIVRPLNWGTFTLCYQYGLFNAGSFELTRMKKVNALIKWFIMFVGYRIYHHICLY